MSKSINIPNNKWLKSQTLWYISCNKILLFFIINIISYFNNKYKLKFIEKNRLFIYKIYYNYLFLKKYYKNNWTNYK